MKPPMIERLRNWRAWRPGSSRSTRSCLLYTSFFGVVPDQWMKHAEGTLAMRSDAILAGPGSTGWFEWLPVRITKATIADFVTVNIYMIGLALTIAMWAVWQGRGASTGDEVETSNYGRPLVKA